LMFPARGFVKDGNLVTSVSSNGFAQSTSTASWQSVDFTYTLTGTDVINGATVYKNLQISTSTGAPILCLIVPPMVGVDGSSTATAAVRVGGPQP